VGAGREKIINGIESMLKKERNWKNPFGNGDSGKAIVKILINQK